MRRKALFLIFVLCPVIVLIVVYSELILYGIAQARGQIHILSNSVPVTEVLENPLVDAEVKKKIRLIKSAKIFAEKIGLASTESYTTYYDQQGKPVLWNISACAPYSFEPYEWHFPFLGVFAYKGYFDINMALEEEQELIRLGYDTRVRSVGAWSTLGWFRDPILSNMTERTLGELAELIFHELTHATFFLKDSLEFNENLASFIGEKATHKFLIQTYGAGSEELHTYIQNEKDAEKFRRFVLDGRDKLDSLYTAIDRQWDDMQKFEAKSRAIRQMVVQLDTMEFYDQSYRDIFDEKLPNNAYFMSFRRYHSFKPFLAQIFEAEDGDIKKFISRMELRLKD